MALLATRPARLIDLALLADELTDTGLAHLAPLVALKMLKLTAGRFNGSGLAALDRLVKLRWLALEGLALDDVGCRLLPQVFPQLVDLDLPRTKVTDKGLASLARLSQLKQLNLCGTKITDEGLSALKPLKHLRELLVNRTPVTPGGVARLKAAIPQLRVIDDHSPTGDSEETPESEDNQPVGDGS